MEMLTRKYRDIREGSKIVVDFAMDLLQLRAHRQVAGHCRQRLTPPKSNPQENLTFPLSTILKHSASERELQEV